MARTPCPEPTDVSEQLPPSGQAAGAAVHVSGLWPPLALCASRPHPPGTQRPQLPSQQPAEPRGPAEPGPQPRPELGRAGRLRPGLRDGVSQLRPVAAGQRQHGQRTFGHAGCAHEVADLPLAAAAAAGEEEGVGRGTLPGDSISVAQRLLQSSQWQLPEHPLPQHPARPLRPHVEPGVASTW